MTIGRIFGARCAIALGALSLGSAASAQTLARRVSSAPDGRVQFSYPGREGVCGNGRSYIQTGPNSYSGTWSDDTRRTDPCIAGPVRVVLDRADRTVISIKTYVGPPSVDPGTTDLGTVRPGDAVDYLLSLARDGEGRVGREAIMPAMLADGVDASDELLAIGRDASRARETRRSALSWLGQTSGIDGAVPARVSTALLQIARDETDNMEVRRSALGVLSRLDHGAGIPPLIELARANLSGDRTWLSKEALNALARSGDPRARDFLRSVIQRGDAADDVMYTAIRGLGTEYATGRDADLLRQVYPKLAGEKVTGRGAVGGSRDRRHREHPVAARRRSRRERPDRDAPARAAVRLPRRACRSPTSLGCTIRRPTRK